MNADINDILKYSETLEVDKLELYFYNYLFVPKAERVSHYINLLNQQKNLNEFESKYGSYLYGYNIKFKNGKPCTGNENILVTYSTDVCFYYMEYRIVFLLDISQSMLTYDYGSHMINVEKIELYLKALLKELLGFQKTIRTVKNEEVLYMPKLILSFATSGNDEDCNIISHEIYLDKTNFEEYFEVVSRKLKQSIMNFPANYRKSTYAFNTSISTACLNQLNSTSVQSTANSIFNKAQSPYLNKILDQSLYLLDLLPRSATPILILFTDSNICISKLGKYNNILMQLGRVDISIYVIDLYAQNRDMNSTSLGFLSNDSTMKYICRFTGGMYFNESDINQILAIPSLRNNNRNMLYYGKVMPREKKNSSNENAEEYIKCRSCRKSISVIFCKKPYQQNSNPSFLIINNDVLERLKENSVNNEYGFNISAIDHFIITKGMKLNQKETFEKYHTEIPLQRITEARIRESFHLLKSNYKHEEQNKTKFQISILPDVKIIYSVKGEKIKSGIGANTYQRGSKFDLTIAGSPKTIRIKIKSSFFLLNHLKLEYIKNRVNIEKSQNNNNSNKPTGDQMRTNIEKIINFIREVMCTDKLLSTFCSVFTEDKEFQNKDNGEREMFINNNKPLWEILSNLSPHTWHRFFNVEIIELMLNTKEINLEEEVANCLNKFTNQTGAISIKNPIRIKSKAAMERIVFNFCDITRPELNFGIKLVPKTINNTNKKFLNGFIVIKISWIYENVALVFMSFFQVFIHSRLKIVEKLIEDIQNCSNDFRVACSNRHLVFLVPISQRDNNYSIENTLLTKKSSRDKESDIFENQCASIFTYRPSKKLINSYLLKKSFKYSHSNRFIMTKFILFLCNQRIKENFSFLNANSDGIILVTKIFVTKVKNIEEVETSKIIIKRCLMLYILKLSDSKEDLSIELSVEPVSGYYLFKFSEKEAKIFDEKNFFFSLTNYYKNIDREIFDSIKNFCLVMKEAIYLKLRKEPCEQPEEYGRKFSKRRSTQCIKSSFNNRYNKDCIYNTYLCFANEDLRKNVKNLLQAIDDYKRELKYMADNQLDDKLTSKTKISMENVKSSLCFVCEQEYLIVEKKVKNEISFLEKIAVDRFYFFFNEFLDSIMDYQLDDDEKCTFYFKIVSKSTLLVLRFPSAQKLLTCCKNQTEHCQNHLLIHIKFFFLSIDKLKQSEKTFAEILSEKKSLKTVDLKEGNDYFSNNINVGKVNFINFGNNKMYFWDSDKNANDLEVERCISGTTKDKSPYSKNELFDIYPIQVLTNLKNLIDHFYKIIYIKNNLISFIENSVGDFDSILSETCSYTVNFDISKILCFNWRDTSEFNEMIYKLFYDMLASNFLFVVANFYCNKKLENEPEQNSWTEESDNTLACSFTPHQNPSASLPNRIERVKDILIISLSIVETINGEAHTQEIYLQDGEKFREIIKEISYNQFKYKSDATNCSLILKIHFVPEIGDIYTDINIEKIKEPGQHISSVNMDSYSIYYYDTNNPLSKSIPAYIQYLNQDYFIAISKKQKSYIQAIYSSLISIQNNIQLESIRDFYNSGISQQKFEFMKAYDLITTINDNYFVISKQQFKVVTKQGVMKYFDREEHEMSLYIIRKDSKCSHNVYMIDFENNADSLVTKFKKFFYDKIERQCVKEDHYKIPLWLIFSVNKTYSDCSGTNIRKFSIEDFQDEEISFEIKWLYTVQSHEKIAEINEQIKEILEFYINSANQKILLNKLKDENECDERLIPLPNKSISSKPEAPPVLCRPQDKNVSFRGFLPKKKYQNVFPINEFHKQKWGSEAFLKPQMSSKYSVEINIEEVYNALLEDARKNFSIKNREDVFKIIYIENDEIFIFRISLIDNKPELLSFAESQISNSSSSAGLKNMKKSAISNSDESKTSHSRYQILIELFGLSSPSNTIIKMIHDFVSEKKQIVKMDYYYNLLSKLEHVKTLKEYEILTSAKINTIESKKIDDAIKGLYSKAKNSWNTLSHNNDSITKQDFELIYNFSEKVNLEIINQAFTSISSMPKNFLDNLIEYFNIFKENKIMLMKYSDEMKIFILPEIPNYAFLIQVSSKASDLNMIVPETQITYELLKRKEEETSKDSLLDIINSRNEVFLMIIKFLDDLLYVSYLLFVNYKKKDKI